MSSNPLLDNPIVHFFQAVVTLRGHFVWDYVWTYLFHPIILQGIIITVVLAVLAQVSGSLIGLLLYFLRRSRFRLARGLAEGYVWLFRGTPLLVQIYFVFALLPVLGLENPLDSTRIFQHLGFELTMLVGAFVAGYLALSLNEGAYMAEIVRAGIDSIDPGQLEAARSLGMTYGLAMRRIVLPQAARVIIPPLGNEFNSMLKNTSLVSAISVADLFGAVNDYFAGPFGRPLEFFTIAAIWYLVMTTVWGFIQGIIERRLNASNIEPSIRSRGSWLQRALGFGRRPVPEVVPGVPAPTAVDRH